jgi:hypothetical protein
MPEGKPVDDAGGPQGEGLVERTQRQNSNLQRLIDAVGTLLAGSRELLKRLQPKPVAELPDDRSRDRPEAGTRGATPSDNPPPTDLDKS